MGDHNDEPFRLFVQRVESLISKENSAWSQYTQAIIKKISVVVGDKGTAWHLYAQIVTLIALIKKGYMINMLPFFTAS